MIPAVFVSHDRDLLDLERPFGVPVMTPAQFLRFVPERAAV
jgi:predicted nucleic acid-binding protein